MMFYASQIMKQIAQLQIVPKQAMRVFFSIVVLALLGCVIPISGVGKMQVELDVFSGRPNPYWDLTSQEGRDFVSRFQTLPQYQGDGSVREGLGYRGLIVREPGKRIEGYDEIVVSNGVVVARWDSQSKQLTDKTRGLEKWLFQTGRGRLDDELYRQVSQSAQLN
jgi:hypothetical protein